MESGSGSGQTVEPPLSAKGSPSQPAALKKLYCGEPLALGITQIIVGILEITFGILLDLEKAFHFYGAQLRIPQCIGIMCIISGSLSVAAAKNPKKPLVKGMLAMNVVSTVTASFALGISSYVMNFHRRPGIQYSGCNSETDSESLRVCRETKLIPYATEYGIVVILFLFHALLLLISFFFSVLGCVTLCHGLGNYDTLTIVVVYQPPRCGGACRSIPFQGGRGTVNGVCPCSLPSVLQQGLHSAAISINRNTKRNFALPSLKGLLDTASWSSLSTSSASWLGVLHFWF